MTTSGLATRVAPKWLILGGLSLFWVGIVVLAAIVSIDMQVVDFIVPMTIMGIGLFVAQIVNLTISQVTTAEQNEGSGTHNTLRELGSALGTAVLGAVLLTTVYSGLTDAVLRADDIDASPAEREQLAVVLEDELSAVAPEDGDRWFEALPQEQQAAVAETVGAAQVDSMEAALVWTAGLVLFGILIATFLPGRRRPDAVVRDTPKPALK
jgi:hypothetical protein